VLGHLPPSQGGPATYLTTIFSSRLAERFELRPYNIGRPPKPAVHDNFGYSGLWNAGVRRMLIAVVITLRHVLLFPLELARCRPAIVHVHTAPYWVFWETAVYVTVCRLFRVPCALQLHYSFRLFYSACSSVTRWLVRAVLRLATTFVVICKEDLGFLREIGADRVAAVYLPNCVDAGALRAGSCDGTEASRDGAAPEVLFLGGSDCRRKGLPELLAAIPAVAARQPEAKFRLVAVPPDLVESLLPAEHRSRCAVDGWVSGGEKIGRLARADLFVLPSHGEGMPIAILEAMAVGLPIVATDVAGIPDMVRDGREGLLVPPGDVPALAAAIASLLGDRELRRSIGGRASARVTEEFDLPRGVDRWDALYRQLLAARPA
jgi:glycosyltransferase involved in cell wall biosynthesis